MVKFQKIDLHKYVKPSKYLKFPEGTSRVRFLTEGVTYRVMGKKTAKGFVRHIVGDGIIPEFLQDAEPKLCYGFVVYSFDTEHFHVVETSQTLGDTIVKLLQEKPDEEYKTTDVLIDRSGLTMHDTKYTVKWSPEATKLPDGISKDHPEFLAMLRNFEE